MVEKEVEMEIISDRRKRTRAIHEEDIEAIVSAITGRTCEVTNHKCLLSQEEKDAIKELAEIFRNVKTIKWKVLAYSILVLATVVFSSIGLSIKTWIKNCIP